MDRAEVRSMVDAMFAGTGDVKRPAVLTHVVPGAFNPATGETAAPTRTSSDCEIVWDDRRFVRERIAQGLAVAPDTDSLMIAGIVGVAPQELDELLVDGVTYRIKDINDVVKAGALWRALVQP